MILLFVNNSLLLLYLVYYGFLSERVAKCAMIMIILHVKKCGLSTTVPESDGLWKEILLCLVVLPHKYL